MTLEAYLLSDRQWPHHLRVAHAEMKLRQAEATAKTMAEIMEVSRDRSVELLGIDFWKAVLAANDKKLH